MTLLHLDPVRDRLPAVARDISVNIQSVLTTSSLPEPLRFAIAAAVAHTARCPVLRDAVLADARAIGVPEATLNDAHAAAVLMAMNNVYYRFRHFVEKEVYTTLPARLRMQRIAKTEGPKGDFELMCLAVSAINGCEACVKAHEAAVLEAGMTPDQVHDAVRIAAAINAAAVALAIC